MAVYFFKQFKRHVFFILLLVCPSLTCEESTPFETNYLCTQETSLRKYLRPITIANTSSGLSKVDCIYVINLDFRPEKWKRVKDLFDEHCLLVNRVPGINGYIISEDEKRELAGPYPTQLRGTQIGCLLSHASILQDAYTRGFKTIWIMEDDVEFVDDLHKLPPLIEKLNEVDPDWDIFYTDTDMRKPDGTPDTSNYYKPRPNQVVPIEEYMQPKINITEDIMRIRRRWGTHSMILSQKGIKKCFEYFTHVYLWGPIDDDLHYIPHIREYAVSHNIVTNWNGSLVSDTSMTLKDPVALISNWPVDTLPAKFENVQKEFGIFQFSTQECEKRPLFDARQFKKIILFNPYLSKTARSTFPVKKMVLFVWEPEVLPDTYYEDFSRVYTWDDSLIDNVKFFKFYYPHLLSMKELLPSFETRKLCTMIASHWVPHRTAMLDFFSSKPSGSLEFYGKTCPQKSFEPMYKGPIPGYHSGPEKISTLSNYRFCLCFENCFHLKGYITEKIFDCFAAGCIPIYWGAPNIDSYVPRNCFINMREFENPEALYKFITEMNRERFEQYIQNIRAYLKSEKALVFSPDFFNKTLYEAVSQ